MTILMSLMSRPRAATSVATSTRNCLLRNAAIVFSRSAWGMSPCSARRSNVKSFDSMTSLHSAFVSQKTMVWPPPPYAPTTSLMTLWFIAQDVTGTHMCLTSSEACAMLPRPSRAFLPPSPTRSISLSVAAPCAYSLAIFFTQGGSVAEKSSSWRVAPAALPMAAKIFSSSSLKPMSSIWSASSSTANRNDDRSSTCFSIKSIVRPGVPTTTSTPRRSASQDGP
mmetsp:Transcript_17672/g.55127  ORF Transcript_17672/g.55127 Transcript_17672/m.55127 type:complete len:224 (-) Transcript_17672:93-764(-)